MRGRVRIGEQSFCTEKRDGRTFLIGNPIVRRFMEKATQGKKYDLNDLADDRELFNQAHLLEFYALLGYSLDGIKELSFFSDLAVNEVVKPR